MIDPIQMLIGYRFARCESTGSKVNIGRTIRRLTEFEGVGPKEPGRRDARGQDREILCAGYSETLAIYFNLDREHGHGAV